MLLYSYRGIALNIASLYFQSFKHAILIKALHNVFIFL